MKTSARNRFAGTVSAVRTGAINDEIEVEVAGGQRIVATVTRESCQELGLVVGAKAFALIKASSVVLMTECDDVKLSARNQIKGKIVQLMEGAVNSEVTIGLRSGASLVAIVTLASAKGLGLAIGAEVVAIFKASSVIIGVEV